MDSFEIVRLVVGSIVIVGIIVIMVWGFFNDDPP
jgi:hypothetical protein